ncbi:hypothetical protein NpNSSI1_00001998 [Neofusicoccum parvum]|nr:hypothetical protein NpNSSI1_00001998 [Neofusicoccum parvum]
MDIRDFLHSSRAAARNLYSQPRAEISAITEALEALHPTHARDIAREMTSLILEDAGRYHGWKYPLDGPLRITVSLKIAREAHARESRTTACLAVRDGGRTGGMAEEWTCEAWGPLEAMLGLRDMMRFMGILGPTEEELRGERN